MQDSTVFFTTGIRNNQSSERVEDSSADEPKRYEEASLLSKGLVYQDTLCHFYDGPHGVLKDTTIRFRLKVKPRVDLTKAEAEEATRSAEITATFFDGKSMFTTLLANLRTTEKLNNLVVVLDWGHAFSPLEPFDLALHAGRRPDERKKVVDLWNDLESAYDQFSTFSTFFTS